MSAFCTFRLNIQSTKKGGQIGAFATSMLI